VKLHQLRYLAAVAQSGLNITAAAHKLHTSQPGVSKQIKLLEDELGFQIFVREGRNLARITPAGQQVIERAVRILQEASAIRSLSTELRDEGKGSLSIGTTHTQARYVLPDVIREFRGRYPQVRLNLHQGTSEQIAEMVASDRIDCAIATGSEHLFSDLTLLPCYRWHRTVIVPKGHPLADGGRLTIKALAAYPLITYTFSFTGPSSLHEAFARASLSPNVADAARRHTAKQGFAERIEIIHGDVSELQQLISIERRNDIDALAAVSVANTYFSGHPGRRIDDFFGTLQTLFPNRIMFICDYYGRLGKIHEEPERFQRTLMHDLAQLVSGQGVPPPDLTAWQTIYDRTACTLIEAFESEHDGIRRFLHIIQL